MVQIRVSCVAQPSSWAWRVNSLRLCADHKLLAIASFIIHYLGWQAGIRVVCPQTATIRSLVCSREMHPLAFLDPSALHRTNRARDTNCYTSSRLALTPETRLGPYEVTARIGVNGMGMRLGGYETADDTRHCGSTPRRPWGHRLERQPHLGAIVAPVFSLFAGTLRVWRRWTQGGWGCEPMKRTARTPQARTRRARRTTADVNAR